MFTRILVPVDGSESSERAVATASDLALKYGAQLTVLHVMEEIGSSRIPPDLENYVQMEHVDVSERTLLEGVARQIVGRAATQAREAKVAKVGQEILVGNPGKTIVDFAAGNAIDLIVMGRRGLGRVAELLSGSVSHRVSQLCRCACLTVR
jgi:nucleotide-binding universal stress UspA family protein